MAGAAPEIHIMRQQPGEVTIMHDYLQAKIELNGSATNNSDQNSAVLLHPVVNDSKQLNNYWIKELYEHYHPIIFNKKC